MIMRDATGILADLEYCFTLGVFFFLFFFLFLVDSTENVVDVCDLVFAKKEQSCQG